MNPFKLRVRAPARGKESAQKKKDRLTKAMINSRLYRLEMAMVEDLKSSRNLTEAEKVHIAKMEERKKKYNNGCAKRMRRLRKKQKQARERRAVNGRKKKPETRKRIEAQREYWRQKKRERRAALTPEQKEQINKERRMKYATKGAKKEAARAAAANAKLLQEEERLTELRRKLQQQAEKLEQQMAQLDSAAEDVRTPAAKRQSLHRVRQVMPEHPAEFVNTTIDLMEKASPKKAAKFKTVIRSPTVENAVIEAVKDGLSAPSSSKTRKVLATQLSSLKTHRLQRSGARLFGVSTKILSKAIRFQAGRKKLPRSTVRTIVDFFEAVSNPLPDKKLVSKKAGEATSVMDLTLRAAYRKFKLEHPDIKVSFSKFSMLRPRHVKTRSAAKLRGCLCEYCENIALKLKVINGHLAALPEKTTSIQSINHLASLTMCERGEEEFHHPMCVRRECNSCGVRMLDEIISPMLEGERSKLEVSWKRWELLTQTVKKGGSKRDIKKRTLVTKTGVATDLIKELKEEASTFTEHLFNKKWQNKQLQLLRQNLPQDTCLCILDFAENYKCSYQDEVQGAYWTQNSATVHPIVIYYHCERCQEVVTESLVFLSDDLVHDFHAVNTFQHVAVKHLIETRKLNIRMMYRFTDGCGQQYKSKGPMSDISYGLSDFGFPITHNYSGSRHGKGASDGESAVVKNHATTAVKAGNAIIKDASDLYMHCRDNLTRDAADSCTHYRRTAFYVPSDSINRERGHRHVRTVPGTMKLHAVKTVSDGVVATRNLSCFCTPCITSSSDEPCHNSLYVGEWRRVSLFNTSATSGKETPQQLNGSVQQRLPVDDDTSTTPATLPEGGTPPSPAEPCDQKLLVDDDTSTTPATLPEGGTPPSPAEPCDQELLVDVDTSTTLPEGDTPLSPAEPCDQDSPPRQSWTPGQWVAVIYDEEWWPGIIVGVLDDTCSINFMKPSGRNKFLWPEREETDMVSSNTILTALPDPPIPISRRYFALNSTLADDVTRKMNMVLAQ